MAAAGLAANQAHVTLFWNSRIRSWAELAELGLPPVESPISALPGQPDLAVDPATGLLTPASGVADLHEDVEATDSPFVQLAGTPLALAGRRAHAHTADATGASCLARSRARAGRLDSGGARGPHRCLRAGIAETRGDFGEADACATATRGRIADTGESGARRPLGSAGARVVLTAGGAPVAVGLTSCLAPGRAAATGTIRTLSTPAASSAVSGTLQSVTVTRAPCRSAARSLQRAR